MNRERMQELRNVIAGIPSKKINLDFPFQNGLSSSPPEACSAVACTAGWAWIYPPFIKAGIKRHGSCAMHAAPRFFDVESNVFSDRSCNESGSDKDVALRRIDKLLNTPDLASIE